MLKRVNENKRTSFRDWNIDRRHLFTYEAQYAFTGVQDAEIIIVVAYIFL